MSRQQGTQNDLLLAEPDPCVLFHIALPMGNPLISTEHRDSPKRVPISQETTAFGGQGQFGVQPADAGILELDVGAFAPAYGERTECHDGRVAEFGFRSIVAIRAGKLHTDQTRIRPSGRLGRHAGRMLLCCARPLKRYLRITCS